MPALWRSVCSKVSTELDSFWCRPLNDFCCMRCVVALVSDLLSRHVNKCHAGDKPPTTTAPTRRKGQHGSSSTRATTSKQACDQCVVATLPCDGANPCCKYPIFFAFPREVLTAGALSPPFQPNAFNAKWVAHMSNSSVRQLLQVLVINIAFRSTQLLHPLLISQFRARMSYSWAPRP